MDKNIFINEIKEMDWLVERERNVLNGLVEYNIDETEFDRLISELNNHYNLMKDKYGEIFIKNSFHYGVSIVIEDNKYVVVADPSLHIVCDDLQTAENTLELICSGIEIRRRTEEFDSENNFIYQGSNKLSIDKYRSHLYNINKG